MNSRTGLEKVLFLYGNKIFSVFKCCISNLFHVFGLQCTGNTCKIYLKVINLKHKSTKGE